MDKKSLTVTIFLNFFGTYKELSGVADIYTAHIVIIYWCIKLYSNMCELYETLLLMNLKMKTPNTLKE